MNKDKSSKELFEYIRSVDIKNIPSLKSILNSYDIPEISIEKFLNNLKNNKENILLLDARSEKEFEETSIPYSHNFPVLSNNERHNVGLIYKKYSQSSALWLAMQYANPKSELLKIFLKENNAPEKNIFVYCWRGGGRSGYLSKMICDLGYKPATIIGGQKSFRKLVNDFFSKANFPYELIELSGLTGSGKTELLRSVSNNLPVIDLEEAARHYSSLLGRIPYHINDYQPIKNQSAFENNLYSQIYFNSQINRLTELTDPDYLIESESRKVGEFEIPKNLFAKLQTAPTIKIISTLENRIERIVRDYFGDDLRGIKPMTQKFIDKEKFFKQQLSNKIYSDLMILLDAGRVSEFTGIMIKEYYDKKYKDKGKQPIAEISTDDINSANEELNAIYKKNVHK